jgi:hypothetical protein
MISRFIYYSEDMIYNIILYPIKLFELAIGWLWFSLVVLVNFLSKYMTLFQFPGGGQLYMWGKIKNTGDDWMYPKPLMDLRFFLMPFLYYCHLFHF